jgi:hypothetical protein
VIFELNSGGQELILHNFTPAEGVGPAGLNLYGGSFYGVLGFGNGDVFKFTR